MSSPRISSKPARKHVCVLGSGAWGSVIGRIIAKNVLYFQKFHPRVTMYVFEEIINGRKLTEIINTENENIKYAKGFKFSRNLVAISDPVDAAKNADILIFVIPHQFIDSICKSLVGKIKPGAIGVSLIKGFEVRAGGGIELISNIISKKLRIPCYVLMGANIAKEVAEEIIVCNSTLGCSNKWRGKYLKDLFQTEHLRITVVDDEATVEVLGALKNIVATGVGFIDGLDQNHKVKEAVIRLGFIEMVQFIDIFYPGGKLSTFFESCGIEDLIVTSFAGRNRRCAEAFARTDKNFDQLEREMLNGQKLQGPSTSKEVNYMLKNKSMTHKFPLFTIIYEICCDAKPVRDLLKCVEDNKYRSMYTPKNINP